VQIAILFFLLLLLCADDDEKNAEATVNQRWLEWLILIILILSEAQQKQ
jgi:hypothetical protein